MTELPSYPSAAPGSEASAAAALAVGVPALLVRRHNATPRIGLVVSEIVVGVPLVVALPASLGATGQAGLKAVVVAALVGVVTTGVAATRPAARNWTADRY